MYKKVPTKTKKCILGSLQEVKVTRLMGIFQLFIFSPKSLKITIIDFLIR